MKLGLVARSDNSGLGMQTWEFYRHMQPVKTMVVDISKHNNNKTYPERYSDNPIGDVIFVTGFPTAPDIDNFLQGLDVVFIAEAAYNPHLYARAKELGVKTAVQYNYEFFDWFNAPPELLPDMFIAPSMWHFADVNAWVNHTNQHTGSNIRHIYLHCPVNRRLLPQREIKKARIFLHNAGRSAAYDRNGTETVIDASRYLKTDAQILIHFQGEQGLPHQATHTITEYAERLARNGDEEKVTIEQVEFANYQDVYKQGDVLLLPRRYGGNCLPLNEALSVGMPVIMTDITPNAGFLPNNWLIPAQAVGQFEPRTVVDIYGSDPQALAAKIDEFYNMTESQMWFENITAGELAQKISWQSLAPHYRVELEALCTQ